MCLLFINIGFTELVIIIAIYLLFFDAKEFPKVMRKLGSITRKIREARWRLEDFLRNGL